MKAMTTFIMAFLCLTLMSCDLLKKSAAPATPIDKGVKIQVYINQNPVLGATVMVDKFIGQTDNKGLVQFGIPNRKKGKAGQIYIKYPPSNIDTTLHLSINSYVPIYLNALVGPKQILANHTQNRQNDLSDIDNQLILAEELLNQAEAEINEYLAAHPGSALTDYHDALGLRRNELNSLKEQVRYLMTDFENVINRLDEGDVVDINEHEKMFMKISSLTNSLISKQNSLTMAQKGILASEPDQEFPMDVLFNEGQYTWNELSADNQDNISGFINKIASVKESTFPIHAYEDLRLRIVAVGYTDGVPVGYQLLSEIAPICQDLNFNYTDSNECLSFLRATEMMEYVRSQIINFSPLLEADGKGSELANGSTVENSALRKCILSFSLIPYEDLSINDDYSSN